MNKNVEKERERLSQKSTLSSFCGKFSLTDLITVYSRNRSDNKNHLVYSAFVPETKVDKSLRKTSWDLHIGDGLPGATVYYEKNQEHPKYFRFGNDEGIEPIVIARVFHGIRPNYKEISEEFRLFHRLYHDTKSNVFIKIDDDGKEEVVAFLEKNVIRIRLKELLQFAAIKEMYLAVFFDCREHSTMTLNDLGLPEEKGFDKRDELATYSLHCGDLDGIGDTRAFSRLLGKRLFAPLPKEKSGFWGFAKEKEPQYVDFIVGADEQGDEIIRSSHAGSAYLTPVYFRKEVLDKYYQKPGKFSIDDGALACGGLWSMTMDNHQDDIVVAWLGDLGRDLPYEEQLHWRSYNIAPSGRPSETFIKRQLLAQFADSDQPEHVFHEKYKGLSYLCQKQLGWSILMPLAEEDQHHLGSLRLPSGNQQKDFDDLILSLAKILIDSLDVKSLLALIPQEKHKKLNGKSIAVLESALALAGVGKEFENQIIFLRNLQNLRSSGSAHRKGSNYVEIAQKSQMDSQNLRDVFAGILSKAITFLNFLKSVVASGKLNSKGTQL